MQGQLILAIRLVSDSETKIKNYKYNQCWYSNNCNLNGTFSDCAKHFNDQYATSSPKSNHELNKYENSLTINKRSNDDTKIGVVSASFSTYDITLKEFRKLMEKQIDELPPSFIFLFNNYPVSYKQEKTIKLKHIASTDGIIDIKRKFSSTRVGVISVTGEIFGFVFLDSSLSVVSIRTNLIKDLQDIHSFKSIENNFLFCDRNGWPLTEQQEFHLLGWDIVTDNMIKIRPYKIDNKKVLSNSELDLNTTIKKYINDRNESTITLSDEITHVDGSLNNNQKQLSNNSLEDNLNNKEDDFNQQQSQQQNIVAINTSNSYSRHTYKNSNSNHLYHPHFFNQNTNNNSPDILNINSLSDSFYKQHQMLNDQTLVKSSSNRRKPILISYVRKEAEQHARNLKTELINLGCDVYLDVDEIKVGMDWQDALNEAVNSCEIFIPLVTPNYGLTLWTNRECKFADILQKVIVPINFLKNWPPDSLAIQFATTQFLPWKTKEEFDEDLKSENPKANDITHWDVKYITRTATQISELIKKRTLEKSYLDDLSSLQDHKLNDDENQNGNAQINSFENSAEENSIEEAEKDDEDDDEIIKLNSDLNEVDTIIDKEFNISKLDQVDQQQSSNQQQLPSLVSLTTFNTNFSQIQTAPKSPTDHLGRNFNDNVLSTLSTKSFKRSINQQTNKTKKLIAISAHPAQLQMVEKLKSKLTPFYNVWSSTDMIKFKDLSFRNSNYSTLGSNRDESDRFSNSLNSLSSSISNSIASDQETNDNHSTINLSEQNFPQTLAKDYDNPLLDNNSINSRYEKQHSKFEKCFYRNQVTKLGKSQWYVESPSTDLNSQSCILQPDEIDKVNIFKEKVNEARIVIIVVSEDYCNSRTSKRQAFYCDFRKQILPILMLPDIKNASHWVGKLMDSPYVIQKSDCFSEFEMVEKVNNKISNMVKEDEKFNCKLMDLKTQEFAEFIQKKLTIYNKEKLYVYVIGSTKFQNPKTEELCIKIGKCLAKREKIILVTGGSLGVADTLAKSFYEERKIIRANNLKNSSPDLKNSKNMILHCNSSTDDQKIDIDKLDVLHILPKGKVNDDFKYKYNSKEDGTFKPLSYGTTVYLGDSIEARDCTVSRVFQFCILIEGGNASAKLAQEFTYYENIVIPVKTGICNNAASACNFIKEQDCGNNLLEMPAGCNEDDWVNLNKSDLPICELGNTIYSIIDSLANYHQNLRCKISDKILQQFDTINKKIYKKKGHTKKKSSDVLSQINSIFKC